MCIDGVGHLVMADERIQQALSNPLLDLVHSQVLMALYSMESSGHLQECRSLLPVYLSTDASRCDALLSALEQAGLLVQGPHGVELTYKITPEQQDHSCGCSMHSHP
jgi:hypothetical protein